MTTQKQQTADDRRKAIIRAKTELTELPKATVRDVQVPILLQLKYSFLVSLVFPLLAGLSFLVWVYGINADSWYHIMCMMLAISGMVALILIMVSIWTLTLVSRLRHLARGNYYVLWRIPETEWQTLCNGSAPNLFKFISIASLITIGVGLSAAGQAYADEKLFFDTVPAHFGMTALISTISGILFGSFLWKLLRLKTEFMSSRSGRVLLGPCGIYRTGNFWSFDGSFQRLYEVSVSADVSRQLNLTIGTNGEHGINYEHLSIPIPKGEMLKAKLLCRILEEKCTAIHRP